MYLIRLDDACSYCDAEKWQRIEILLDTYSIKPIVAIIPNCEDTLIRDRYAKDESFWDRARTWQKKGWIIALHGYNHVYINHKAKGINPINDFSEFAGVPLKKQKEKIRNGLELFNKERLATNIFVPPAHSFDANTLCALEEESNIRIISDTIARDIYWQDGFYFIPQQCGTFRKMPFNIVTGCYHPNSMNNKAFIKLRAFIQKNQTAFGDINLLPIQKRKYDAADKIISLIYFSLSNLRKRLNG